MINLAGSSLLVSLEMPSTRRQSSDFPNQANRVYNKTLYSHGLVLQQFIIFKLKWHEDAGKAVTEVPQAGKLRVCSTEGQRWAGASRSIFRASGILNYVTLVPIQRANKET